MIYRDMIPSKFFAVRILKNTVFNDVKIRKPNEIKHVSKNIPLYVTR